MPLIHSETCSKSKAVLLFPPGEDIKELFLDLALMSQGSSVLNFSYPICEVALPRFSFCGRRKGGKPSVLLTACRGLQRDQCKLASKARTPRPELCLCPSPLDEFILTYQHVLHKNNNKAHSIRPTLQGCCEYQKEMTCMRCFKTVHCYCE